MIFYYIIINIAIAGNKNFKPVSMKIRGIEKKKMCIAQRAYKLLVVHLVKARSNF